MTADAHGTLRTAIFCSSHLCSTRVCASSTRAWLDAQVWTPPAATWSSTLLRRLCLMRSLALCLRTHCSATSVRYGIDPARMRPPGRPGYSQGPAGCDRGPRSELDAADSEPCPPVLRSLPPARTFACRQRTPIRRLRHRRGCRHGRGTVPRSAQPRTGQLSTTTSSGYSSTSHTYPGPHGLAYPGEYVRGPGRAARRWPQPGHARRPHHLHPPPARQRRHPLHAKSGTTSSHGWSRLPTHGWPRLPTASTSTQQRSPSTPNAHGMHLHLKSSTRT